MKLFVCGDVMSGRGIDQILPSLCDPAIDEPWMKSAVDYVRLAEQASGPIPRAADPSYIWGDALAELEREAPAARIDCCVLANNHVLDWGRPGLLETLETLHGAGIRTAGAGRDAAQALAPAILNTATGRLLAFGFGLESAGVPEDWAAGGSSAPAISPSCRSTGARTGATRSRIEPAASRGGSSMPGQPT